MRIDWTYPDARQGFWGILDQITGPGATSAELALQFIPPLGAAIAVLGYGITLQPSWTTLMSAIAALLVLDLLGGIITNATSTAKRWYHRPGQGFKQHLSFIALHGIHVFVVAWLFRSRDIPFFLSVYAYLLISSTIILRCPLYLQRPVAFLLYGLGVLLNSYLLTATVGLEWFLPLFLMKLLISHLLKEAPYRANTLKQNYFC